MALQCLFVPHLFNLFQFVIKCVTVIEERCCSHVEISEAPADCLIWWLFRRHAFVFVVVVVVLVLVLVLVVGSLCSILGAMGQDGTHGLQEEL